MPDTTTEVIRNGAGLNKLQARNYDMLKAFP